MRETGTSHAWPFFAAGLAAGYSLGRVGAIQRVNRDTRYRRPTASHPIPRIPISIDGDKAEPHDIKQFDGHALYYVLDQRVQDGNLLPVFTSLKIAESYLSQANAPLRIGTPGLQQSSQRKRPELPTQSAMGDVIGDVWLYDKAGFNGNWVTFSDGTDVPDFRHVWCFLWWCQDWNDRPVSVQADVGSKWTVLHEDIYYQGSSALILSGSWIPDLSAYGWAYRASSLSFSWVP